MEIGREINKDIQNDEKREALYRNRKIENHTPILVNSKSDKISHIIDVRSIYRTYIVISRRGVHVKGAKVTITTVARKTGTRRNGVFPLIFPLFFVSSL